MCRLMNNDSKTKYNLNQFYQELVQKQEVSTLIQRNNKSCYLLSTGETLQSLHL